MAPKRGGSGSSSGGSSGSSGSDGGESVCPGCSYPLEVFPLGLSNPYIAAAMAFAIINAIAFLVLWILSLKTQRYPRPNKTKGTRYALHWALLALLCFQLIDLAMIIIQNIRFIPLYRGILIIYPFSSFLVYASDVAVVWTIFGVIRSRLQALNGENKLVKMLRILAVVSTSILAALAIANLGIFSRVIAFNINRGPTRTYSSSRASGEYDSVLSTYRAAQGISVTRHVLEVLLSIFFIGMAVKLRLAYRYHATRSKIPIFLLTLVAPWYFARSLSSLATEIAFDIQAVTPLRIQLIVLEITYGLFSVPIFTGLIMCAWQSMGPMQFSKHESQQPQAPLYFNAQDQMLQQPPQQPNPQTMPNGVPYAGSHQSWSSGSTPMPYGYGQGYHPSVPQNGIIPPQHQQQQSYQIPHGSHGGFYQPQPYPPQQQYGPPLQQHYGHPLQPGSPLPTGHHQNEQLHANGAAELGQYRTLSPHSNNAGSVSPANTSPGQSHAVPEQAMPHDGGMASNVVR